MKILTISRSRLELARAHLKKPFVTIGRSPSCDVVLRAPGVQAIHFIIEWIGSGVFNPNHGVWSIADISTPDTQKSGAVSGEGVVFSEDPTELSGFVFTCIDDRLESAEQIGGKIVENMSTGIGKGEELLELIHVRTDSGAIEEVRHLRLKRAKKPERVFNKVKEFKIAWDGKKTDHQALVRVLLEEMTGAEVFNRGKKIEFSSTGAAIGVTPFDILQVRWSGRDFYVRLVGEVKSPPIPHDVVGSPLLRNLFAGVGITAFLLLYWAQSLPPWDPAMGEKPPLRIARVEVPEPPKVAETPAPVETPDPAKAIDATRQVPPKDAKEPGKILEGKPEKKTQEKDETKKTPPKSKIDVKPAINDARKPDKADPSALKSDIKDAGRVASPSFANDPKGPTKAGLNAPSPVSDVNAIGILGAINKAGPKGKGVQLGKIVNDAVVTESISGAGASKIILKNPPVGTLGSGSSGSPQSTDTKSNLSSASTTLSGIDQYDPRSAGAIAVKDQSSGVSMGADLSGDKATGSQSGVGGLESGEFSVEGGGLDRETVRKVIASHRGEIRICYERALLTKAELEGRIAYDWRIGADGVVVTISVLKSTVKSANLATCVQDVVKRMQFPKAANGHSTRVIYPFLFQGRK